MKLPLSKSNIIAIAIAILVIFIFIIMLFAGRSHDIKPVQEQVWNVSSVKIIKADLQPAIILHGTTESPRKTSLEAAINADVKKTHFYEGSFVKKDAVLIELDDREARYQLQQRQADVQDLDAQINAEKIRNSKDKQSLTHDQQLLELAKRALERQLTLVKQKVGSDAAADQAREKMRQEELKVSDRSYAVNDHVNRLNQLNARLKRAQALQDKADLDLERTKIKAPFNGRISKLSVAVGDRVQAGEMLLEMYDTDAVEVRTQIPSQYVGKVQQALANKQVIEASAEVNKQKISLILDRLSAAVSRGKAGVDGFFRVAKHKYPIALGQAIEVIVDLPLQKGVYRLPIQALYGTSRIYIANEGRMRSVEVTRVGYLYNPGETTDILVRSPQLKDGDQVITTQLPNARDGLKIKLSK